MHELSRSEPIDGIGVTKAMDRTCPAGTISIFESLGSPGYSAKVKYLDQRVAARYDKRFKGIEGALKQWNTRYAVRKALRFAGRDNVILDLPCGTGRMIPVLNRMCREWWGGDISPAMIEKAKGKVNGSVKFRGFLYLDAEKIDLGDGAVDCVLSMRFIHHLPCVHRLQVLREFRRIARKKVIIEYRTKNRVREFLRNLVGAKPGRLGMNLKEIQKEIEAAGLILSRVIPVSRLFSNSAIIICSVRP